MELLVALSDVVPRFFRGADLLLPQRRGVQHDQEPLGPVAGQEQHWIRPRLRSQLDCNAGMSQQLHQVTLVGLINKENGEFLNCILYSH